MKPTIICISPYYFGVGDYRSIVLDFPCELFLRDGFTPIYRPEMRRLTSE